jgi:DNA topoisomerase I
VHHKTSDTKAQEAHEAIRPTSVMNVPEKIKSYLKPEQFKLYQLIWRRFVASQMKPAVYETLSVVIEGKYQDNSYTFRASGSELKFPGFLVLYEEAKDDDAENGENGTLSLPEHIKEGDQTELLKLNPAQHFTQPPPRFTEASLIQVLEEYGIGRPSTYAPIISTIQSRGYVERDGKRLMPTDTGITVNDLLIEFFPNILGVHFTANLESELDKVANGDKVWQQAVKEFYKDFEPKLKHAQDSMPERKTEPELVGRACPECGNDLIIKWGRFGKFISCNNYPECKYTEPYLEKIDVNCPKDGGDLVVRKTKRGRVFYGCSNYPECDFSSWKKPIKTPCPVCGGLLTYKNKTEFQCMDCDETISSDSIEIE